MEHCKINKCALCQKEKVLCLSHLISKGFYKHITENGKILKVFKEKATIPPGTGQIKSFLLCQECENLLSRSEKIVLADGYESHTTTFPLHEKLLKIPDKYPVTIYPDSFMVFPNEKSNNWCHST